MPPPPQPPSTSSAFRLVADVQIYFRTHRGARPEGPAPIDSVAMRRKRAGRIQEEQAAVRDRVEHYRPPYIKVVGENEKSRYELKA